MEDIHPICFPDDVYEIKKNIDQIIRTATETIKSALYGYNDTTKKDFFKDFLHPYFKDVAFVTACLKKTEVGLNKLRTKEVDSHPNLRYIIYNAEESLVVLKTKWIPMLEVQRSKKKKRNRIVAMVIIFLLLIICGEIVYML